MKINFNKILDDDFFSDRINDFGDSDLKLYLFLVKIAIDEKEQSFTINLDEEKVLISHLKTTQFDFNLSMSKLNRIKAIKSHNSTINGDIVVRILE